MERGNTSNTALKERIFQIIGDSPHGAVSFAQFMELALYEPNLGYYSQAGRPIGRESGDFYTSVSVGKCYGLLLGYAIEAKWQKADRPADWLIAEQGAHDGQLALDILEGFRQRNSPILENLGYEVATAENGRAGLELFEQNPGAFDLVLLDMMMPEMNGRDCFAALKKIKPSVRVVLSSGFLHEEDLIQMKENGLNGFVNKPYLSSTLSQVVHDALA